MVYSLYVLDHGRIILFQSAATAQVSSKAGRCSVNTRGVPRSSNRGNADLKMPLQQYSTTVCEYANSPAVSSTDLMFGIQLPTTRIVDAD